MERLFNYYSVGSTTDEIPEEKIIKNSNSEPTSQMSSPESVMACGLGDARNVSTGTMYPGSLQRGTYENPSEFLTAQATIGSREDAKNSKSPTMPFLKPPLILTMRECLSDEALLTESLLQQVF